ncbi:MAG: hypothetical protein ACKO37_05720 [Vampirovibrionales bacterium]
MVHVSHKLFVATPMYGGLSHGVYMQSCLELQRLCISRGIPLEFSFMFNESLITRARNQLTHLFLHETDATHLLFVDADIRFHAPDILTLLAFNKDIIGIPYPKKVIDWHTIARACQHNPNVSENTLEQLTGKYAIRLLEDEPRTFKPYEPLKVAGTGTGLMMISREALLKFQAAYPELYYKVREDDPCPTQVFFDTVIEPETKAYLSEDYMFCEWARRAGIPTWVCPWMCTAHAGTYHFQGNPVAQSDALGYTVASS